MAQGRRTPQAQAARVIADVLLGQESQRQIAEKHGVGNGTVARLAHTSPEYLERLEQEKKRDVADLVTGYLKESLVTLRVQLEHCRDKDWLKDQSAGDVAILHGVLHDKAVRILSAIRLPPEGDPA